MHSLGKIYSALVYLNERPNSLRERFYVKLILPYLSELMTQNCSRNSPLWSTVAAADQHNPPQRL